eukprot:2813790-Rhodomonas_salina.2
MSYQPAYPRTPRHHQALRPAPNTTGTRLAQLVPGHTQAKSKPDTPCTRLQTFARSYNCTRIPVVVGGGSWPSTAVCVCSLGTTGARTPVRSGWYPGWSRMIPDDPPGSKQQYRSPRQYRYRTRREAATVPFTALVPDPEPSSTTKPPRPHSMSTLNLVEYLTFFLGLNRTVTICVDAIVGRSRFPLMTPDEGSKLKTCAHRSECISLRHCVSTHTPSTIEAAKPSSRCSLRRDRRVLALDLAGQDRAGQDRAGQEEVEG